MGNNRVLFVMQLPPPIHGAAVINQLIARNELIRKDYSTRILSLRFVNDVQEIRRFSLRKIFVMVVFFFKLASLLLLYRPRLVYFTISPQGNSFYRDALYVLLIKLFRTRLAFHLHSVGIRKNTAHSPFKRKLYKLVFRNSSVVCLSELLKSEFRGLSVKEILVLHNSIPDRSYDLTERDNETPRILFLSNLFRDKGILVFLEIVKKLVSKGYSFKAEIVGANGDITSAEVERYVAANKLSEYAIVCGPAYGEDKYKVLGRASIFCMPSLDEAFPLVVLEAMQASLSIVASDVGGVPDIITDWLTGFLCTPGDTDLFVDRIAMLLDNAAIRQRTGINAWEEFNKRFNLSAFENRVKSIIDHLMA